MKIETKYTYEKVWSITNEDDLLKIITDEVGDADPKGTLEYIKSVVKKGKEISVGTCKFRESKKG